MSEKKRRRHKTVLASWFNISGLGIGEKHNTSQHFSDTWIHQSVSLMSKTIL